MTGYNKLKNKRYNKLPKHALGEFLDENSESISTGANFIADASNIFASPNKANVALGTIQGGLKGAAIGTKILPGVGTAVGLGLGALTSFLSGKKKKQEFDRQREQQRKEIEQANIARSNKVLSTYATTGIEDQDYYADGGEVKPKKKTKLNEDAFVDGKLMVEKADGSIGHWGNDLKPLLEKKLRLYPNGEVTQSQLDSIQTTNPKLFKLIGKPIIKNNQIPQFGTTDSDYIKSALKTMAKGGIPNAEYEVEKNEVIQGRPVLEEGKQLSNDMHLVGGQRHENGGTEGAGGERIFSDRLTISQELRNLLKENKITLPASTTYADASKKIGILKGKYENKLSSYSKPTANTGRIMMGRYENLLDNIFQEQEATKPRSKVQESGLEKKAFGDFLEENSGELLNLGSYLANLGSINKLDTRVDRTYLDAPTYDYVDRSGSARAQNQRTYRSALRSLTGTSSGVNASNVSGLHAATLEANSRVANDENMRRDSYNERFAQRADRVNYMNTSMRNEASDMQRAMNNEKYSALPLQARNTFLQGVMGNQQVKAQKELDEQKMVIDLFKNNENGVISALNPADFKKMQVLLRSLTKNKN